MSAGKSSDDVDAKNIEIVVPFKYLDIYWKTLKMLRINYEINVI